MYEERLLRQEREDMLSQRAKVIWFTGLSGSGKTTLASELNRYLLVRGYLTYQIDGDRIRSGLNQDLGFSEEDRMENIRRVGEIARMFLDCGVICICSFITPTEEIRKMVKNIIGEKDFYEVYLSTPIDVCEQRDPKGLYKKARAGLLQDFTGVTAPFEIPANPDLVLDTSQHTQDKCLNVLTNSIISNIVSFQF